MEDVKPRIAIMEAIVKGFSPLNREDFDGEVLCLHLRKTLEMIAFASLSAHKNEYEKIYRNFSTQWNAKRLVKGLKKLNPDYFPKPLKIGKPQQPNVKHFEYLEDGFLTEENLIFLYDKCGAALHSRNPYKPGKNIVEFERPLSEWIIKIKNLLYIHQIRLFNSDECWMVIMDNGDGKVHVFPSTPVPSHQANSSAGD